MLCLNWRERTYNNKERNWSPIFEYLFSVRGRWTQFVQNDAECFHSAWTRYNQSFKLWRTLQQNTFQFVLIRPNKFQKRNKCDRESCCSEDLNIKKINIISHVVKKQNPNKFNQQQKTWTNPTKMKVNWILMILKTKTTFQYWSSFVEDFNNQMRFIFYATGCVCMYIVHSINCCSKVV